MNDHSRGPAPLVGAHTLSWLGAAAFVAVAVGCIAAAYFLTRPAGRVDAASRVQQIQLRRDLETKAQELLTQPALNTDGTYRVPIDQAMALLAADNRRFAQFRAASQPDAAPAPAAK